MEELKKNLQSSVLKLFSFILLAKLVAIMSCEIQVNAVVDNLEEIQSFFGLGGISGNFVISLLFLSMMKLYLCLQTNHGSTEFSLLSIPTHCALDMDPKW